MADPLILIAGDGRPVKLQPAPYDTEQEFQDLVARYPELLAGEQIDREVPRRWLLVGVETSISDVDGGSGRWNLDHLFVDQDGVPTLVEIKRQSDTRLRREVIGQVLEYAANAGRTWTAQFLEEAFAETCRKRDPLADPASELAAFLEETSLDPAHFWQVVSDKLQKGDMRLLFVADRVPPELVRIIEFLNSQTLTTEILAIEVQRYSGGGYSTHVPRLLGQTTRAIDAKSAVRAGGARRTWDDTSFREDTSKLISDDRERAKVLELFELAQGLGFATNFGNGVVSSLNLRLPDQSPLALLTLKSNGEIVVNSGSFKKPEDKGLLEALAQFVRTSGCNLPENYASRSYLTIPLRDWVQRAESVGRALRALAAVSRT